jgi:hypothetical protein
MTSMLAVFDAFCRRHGIPYALGGGGLIGALLCGGWLPWYTPHSFLSAALFDVLIGPFGWLPQGL